MNKLHGSDPALANYTRGKPKKILSKFSVAILLPAMLGLAGCPEDTAQKDGASSSESRGSSGD
jgi:hypothetical protein